MYIFYIFDIAILFACLNYDCHHHYCHLYLWHFYIYVCISLSIAGLPVRCRASFGLRIFHHRRMVPACSDDIINVSLWSLSCTLHGFFSPLCWVDVGEHPFSILDALSYRWPGEYLIFYLYIADVMVVVFTMGFIPAISPYSIFLGTMLAAA